MASLAETQKYRGFEKFESNLLDPSVDLYICGESICLGKGFSGVGQKKLEHSMSDNFLSTALPNFDPYQFDITIPARSAFCLKWFWSEESPKDSSIDVHRMSQILTHNIWKSIGGKPHQSFIVEHTSKE